MFQLSGYGMLPPGQWWQRWGKGLKNAANTSVIALPDKLLALWEGGPPHAIDLESLSTLGLDDLQGLENLPYSAHPKVDPATGDIFNFGVSLGAKARLNLYRSDRTGQIRQKGVDRPARIARDSRFCAGGALPGFLHSPVRLNPLPILAYLKSYSDALHWQPELGTEIIVVDRASSGSRQSHPDGTVVSVAFRQRLRISRWLCSSGNCALRRFSDQSVS
jgi:carotenoid cleavage dioxygenase-like enzyme